MWPHQHVATRLTIISVLLHQPTCSFTHVATKHVFGHNVFSSRSRRGQELYTFKIDRDETTTTLFYKNDPQDTMIDLDSISLEDLPRTAMEREVHAKLLTPVGKAEIYIGRVAMVAAVFLFSTEMLTGMSLPEQFTRFY